MITSKLIITLIVVVGSIFASNGFWDWLKTRKGKMTPYERVTIAIGREKLNKLSKKYIKRQYIPEDEFESFKELGEAYLDAGGNSMVKELYQDAMKLPKKWDIE
jgi:hypothetical protein